MGSGDLGIWILVLRMGTPGSRGRRDLAKVT